MKPDIIIEKQRLIKTSPYLPAVTVIMPFDPKMFSKNTISVQLNRAVDKVEAMIKKDYDNDLNEIVLQKLKRLLRTLNYNTYKKSIAVYLSPVFEKVIYVDIPVEEKIMIGDSYDLKELVNAKKEQNQYLLLMVHNSWSKLYLGSDSGILKIKSNFPEQHLQESAAETRYPYASNTITKSLMMYKFLRNTDKGLGYLISVYQLPVFVIGNEEVLVHYRTVTQNNNNILEFIEGAYEQFGEKDLHRFIHSYITDWSAIKQEDIRQRMTRAAACGKLASGIEEVWKLTNQHRGHLLILEKNYNYFSPVIKGGDNPAGSYNKFSNVKDPIDEMIEKVLEDGGDVEFADGELLKNYQHIALIQQG